MPVCRDPDCNETTSSAWRCTSGMDCKPPLASRASGRSYRPRAAGLRPMLHGRSRRDRQPRGAVRRPIPRSPSCRFRRRRSTARRLVGQRIRRFGQDRGPLRSTPDEITGAILMQLLRLDHRSPGGDMAGAVAGATVAGARPAYARPSTSGPDRGFAPIPSRRCAPSFDFGGSSPSPKHLGPFKQGAAMQIRALSAATAITVVGVVGLASAACNPSTKSTAAARHRLPQPRERRRRRAWNRPVPRLRQQLRRRRVRRPRANLP